MSPAKPRWSAAEWEALPAPPDVVARAAATKHPLDLAFAAHRVVGNTGGATVADSREHGPNLVAANALAAAGVSEDEILALSYKELHERAAALHAPEPTITVTIANDRHDQRTVERAKTMPWSDWARIVTTHERRPDKEQGSSAICYTLARFRDEPCGCGEQPRWKTSREGRRYLTKGCPDLGHVPGAPHNGHRIERNVLEVTALGIDFDKDEHNRPLDEKSTERILLAFAEKKIRATVASTHSYNPTAGKHAFRVCVALSRPVPIADWGRFLPAALALIGIPAGCHADARHIWYFPSAPEGAEVVAHVFKGEPLDVDAILASAPNVESRAQTERRAEFTGEAPPEVLKRAAESIERIGPHYSSKSGVQLPPGIEPSPNGHTRRLCALLRNDFALSVDDAHALLAPLNARSVPPYDDHALRELLEDVLEWADPSNHGVQRLFEKPRSNTNAAPPPSNAGPKIDPGYPTQETLDRVAEARKQLEESAKPKVRGMWLRDVAEKPHVPVKLFATGFVDLDRMLGGGLATGQQTAVAAPPSLGKSAFVGSVLLALSTERPGLAVSTEMTTDDLLCRFAGHALNVPWIDCVLGKVPRERMLEAVRSLRIQIIGCDDLFDDPAAREDPLGAIWAAAEAMRAECGEPPIIVIDYVQVMARGGEDGLRSRVSELSMRGRQLAQTLDTVVLAVFTIGRTYYVPKMVQALRAANDPRGYLVTLKESGDIEYDCATVLFLDVDEEVCGEGADQHRSARIVVARCRQGREGFVGARFYPATGRWAQDPLALATMSVEGTGDKKRRVAETALDESVRKLVAKVREGLAAGMLKTKSQWRDSSCVSNCAEAVTRALETGALVIRSMERKEGLYHKLREIVVPRDWSPPDDYPTTPARSMAEVNPALDAALGSYLREKP